jgi:hypothetical protein
VEFLSSLQEEWKGRKEDSVAKQPAHDKVRMRASCSCALAFLGGFGFIGYFFRCSGNLPPAWRAEHNLNVNQSKWIQHMELISCDATIDINVELYKMVHNSYSDIDIVFALLLLLKKVWVYRENKALHCLTMLILFLFW